MGSIKDEARRQAQCLADQRAASEAQQRSAEQRGAAVVAEFLAACAQRAIPLHPVFHVEHVPVGRDPYARGSSHRPKVGDRVGMGFVVPLAPTSDDDYWPGERVLVVETQSLYSATKRAHLDTVGMPWLEKRRLQRLPPKSLFVTHTTTFWNGYASQVEHLRQSFVSFLSTH